MLTEAENIDELRNKIKGLQLTIKHQSRAFKRREQKQKKILQLEINREASKKQKNSPSNEALEVLTDKPSSPHTKISSSDPLHQFKEEFISEALSLLNTPLNARRYSQKF